MKTSIFLVLYDIFVESDDDIGRYEFELDTPGLYRVRVWQTERFDPEVGTVWDPPFAQWIEQALGDPSRIGFPKDHTLYVLANRSRSGDIIIQNFPYTEDSIPPNPVEDSIQVLINSSNVQLDVLANDGDESLTIIGLGLEIDENLIPGSTDITGTLFNSISTDGQYVYYFSPFQYQGIDSFYYVVEDGEGNRDFAQVFVNNVTEIITGFTAVDDFATVPLTEDRARLNLLANDVIAEGTTRDQLEITAITTPTAGGSVSFQGTNVIYSPPPDFMGTDTFMYTLSDGSDQTDEALVTIVVAESPVSDRQRALLNMILQLFGSSSGGQAVYRFFTNHMSEFNYLILNQGQNPVLPKGNGKPALSQIQVGGTAETEANWKAILDRVEPGIAAALAGQGDSVTVSQELVDDLMTEIDSVLERASPELKADLEAICELTNDFQDLVGKTYNEGAVIMGIPPGVVSLPTLALQRINDVISITTWDVAGLAFKLWKSNNLQEDSWEEVENAEIETEGATAKLTDPDVGDGNVFYRISSEVE